MGNEYSGTKGKTNNPNGRTKGVPNRATTSAREAIARFVDDNSEKFQEWLDAVATGKTKDGIVIGPPAPDKAFSMVQAVIEYHVPKLNRTEMQTLDKNGQPTNPVQSLTPHQQEALDRWAAEKYNLGNKEPKE